VEHSYRSYRTRLGFVKLVQSWALVAANICSAASCSSSDTGSQQSTDGGPGDASAMGMPPEGGTEASVAVSDAGTTDVYSTDGMAKCPSYRNSQVGCSLTCNGNCIDNSGAHIGDCFFTDSSGLVQYCAPWGVMDPCSHCP